LRSSDDRSQALELAADNWGTALALLRYHAQLLEGPAAPSTLRYRLPPTAPVLHWMIGHLEVLDTSHWTHPADEWVVRIQSFHHRDAGWMARLVDLPTFTQTMLPEWQSAGDDLYPTGQAHSPLGVGDASCVPQIEGTELRLVNQGSGAEEAIHLTSELFIQVVFGYHSVAWAVQQSGQFVNSELLALRPRAMI
jgi:hypothetical protein